MTGRSCFITRYSLAGFGAGCLFVLTAWWLEGLRLRSGITFHSIVLSHKTSVLVWIIDTAPLVLGGAGAMLGSVSFKLKSQMQDLEKQVEARTHELSTANSSLVKQRDSFAHLAESLPVGVMRVNNDGLHLNREALKITGRNANERYSWNDFCAAMQRDHAALLDMLHTHARLGRPAKPEIISFSDAEGMVRDLEISCVVENDTEVWVLHDLTEMVTMQRDLRESRASNIAMLAALPDTFVTVGKDGVILSAFGTDEFCDAFPDFHAGNILDAALPERECELFQQLVGTCVTAGDVQSMEFKHTCNEDPDAQSWWDVRAVNRTNETRVLIIRNISERKGIEAALQRLGRQHELMLESIGEGVYSIDEHGICNSVNNESCNLLGYTADEIIGSNVHDLVHHSHEDGTAYPVEVCPIYQCMHGCYKGKTADDVFWRKDGTALPVEYIATPMFENGKLVGAVVCFMDITERKQLELQLRQQLEREKASSVQLEAQRSEMESQQHELIEVNHKLEAFNAKLERQAAEDGLTGLQNHIAFQDALYREISRCQRYGSKVSLVMLDVDHFKHFNDTYGHPGGDEILRQVARTIEGVIRTCDIAARYGGEEFAIILPETNEGQSRVAAERIRAAIQGADWPLRAVTVSVGVATFGEAAETTALLVSNADRALYCSKHSGRNCVTHASDMDAGMKSEASSRPYTDVLKSIFTAQEDIRLSAQEQVKDVLLESYDRTILTWGRLLDSSDPLARGRSARLCELVERLARLAGLNEEEVLYARWGSLLHNIGEISLMRSQPGTGRQTAAARESVLRQHPQIAYEFMMTVPLLMPAVDIPYCHHERWDGSGFPRGIKGDEIPLTARLFAAASHYDRLVTGTADHDGLSHEDVVAQLNDAAGKSLDPRAVRLLIKMVSPHEVGTELAA